ncbi:putative ABC transport system permease protein [Larkinella arboricola]|uniref:Putative ABC transport system permease protein n=1 Tax=Larkinella arboricola TaxID=643671 RepID=A0A327WWD1_LARAB|nr:ABC transporter permease [Larkinella arboricola]RAJ97622.1 putative ABC transport system permease protein [Larkinella arboricola]
MLRNYLKITLRTFWKNKLFSGLNVVGLGIGMAAVWLMALYVFDEWSYDRFHAQADRIVRVVHYAQWPGGNLKLAPTSAPYGPALKNEYPEVEKVVRIHPEGGGTITFNDKKIEASDIFFADPTVFGVFSLPFLYGDPASALQKPQTIVLTRNLAEALFGDASQAVGKTVEFSNHFPNTVTGVIEDVPTNSHLRFSALRSLPANYTSGWQNFELYTYLLLAKGSDARTLEAKLPGFFQKYIQPEMGNVDYRIELQPLTSIHLHSQLDYEIGPNGNARTVSIFAGVAVLILLIACINYVNLYTARSLKRTREVGVRQAIGSYRWQLIGQFLTESMLMTFLAGLVSMALVTAALPYFNQLADKALSFDNLPATWLAVVIFSLLIGALSGLYPALLLSGFRPVAALRGMVGDQSGNSLFRQSLVVFQFVAAFALIVCSGLVYRQMRFVMHKDLGFNKEQVLTFHIDSQEVRQRVTALKEALLRNPLIQSVSTASNPIGNNNIGGTAMFFEQNGTISAGSQVVQKFLIDEDYLKTLEIKLLAGRNFSESFKSDLWEAVLINETLVKQLGWKKPIGKRVKYFIDAEKNTAEARVVGVVKDFHIYSLQHKIEPLVLQMPVPADKDNVYLRIQPDKVTEALGHIRSVYRTFDPASTPEFHFLDENFSRQYQAERKQGQILLTFTVLAVFIACLGLFGLAAFAAEQRTKEIGVRKVLGASVASIVALLSRDFLKLVAVAIVLATPIAWYVMSQWLQSFEYRLDPAWWVFALAGLVSIFVALLTVCFQGIRAALANPVKSLRSE